jgi:hypothetical protein
MGSSVVISRTLSGRRTLNDYMFARKLKPLGSHERCFPCQGVVAIDC